MGRPNVGKSTLVNALVGQQGRDRLRQAADHAPAHPRDPERPTGAQVVFTDTPGFHKPRTLLGTRLNNLVRDAVEGVDAVVLVVDAASGVGRGDAYVYAQQVGAGERHEGVRGEQDRRPAPPQPGAAARGRRRSWASSTRSCRCRRATGEGVDVLRDLLVARMPEGPPLFPVGRGHRRAARDHAGRARAGAGAARRRARRCRTRSRSCVDEMERDGRPRRRSTRRSSWSATRRRAS